MIGGDNGNAGNISERQTKVVKVKDVRMEPSKSHIIQSNYGKQPETKAEIAPVQDRA